MERRAFLNLAVKKARAPAPPPMQWVRPPYAAPELHFLAACTRCDACIPACPHHVMFKLSEKAGRLAAGTPAMDLINYGCHMCPDTPCVTACEPGALRRDPLLGKARDRAGDKVGDKAEDAAVISPFPTLAVATIDEKSCLPYSGPECGACAHSCPVPGALHWVSGVRPVINAEACTGCALCREACIVSPKAIKITAAAKTPDVAPAG
ncbi:MAG: 4Fe-4S dicluster domain-containing protein [Alphaproteobacteria bacterium]